MTDAEKRIQKLGKEIMEKAQELHRMRLQLPPKPVADYVFRAPGDREVRLSELFGGKQDLLLVHNMGSQCPYCTLWADSLNGVLAYLEDRAAFVLVSPDEPEVQERFAETRGWNFQVVSDRERRFTREMGFWGSYGGDAKAEGPWPGFSTFRTNDDGTIERVACDFFGPGDLYLGLWHLFANLDRGVDGWQPAFQLPD